MNSFAEHTILVVDDNSTNLGIIVSYLEKYNFNIIVARSGENALKRVQHGRPDIILLDIMMPGLDGFETCLQLKADKATADIPVIFMTALASIEDKVKGFEVGGVDYITKPIQQAELIARLTTHLRIRDLTLKLQKANQDKDRFFSILAHDLKGPFQPVLGMAELLPKTADSLTPDDIRRMGNHIYKAAKNVFNLLENLLQWSRLQMERLEYQPKQIDLHKAIEQNVTLLASNAENKGVTIQNSIPANTTAYVDENILNTVVRNLVSNALKFTSRGGSVTISADFGVAEQSNAQIPFVEIAVTDTGVGMTEDIKQKLFKLGEKVTVLGTAKEQGTGLGLIICQEMVNMAGGQILVESKMGKGTTMRVLIPQDTADKVL